MFLLETNTNYVKENADKYDNFNCLSTFHKRIRADVLRTLIKS